MANMQAEALGIALEALEIAQDNLRPHGDNCFLHDEGEYNRCFCGKDSLSDYLQDAVEKLDTAIKQALAAPVQKGAIGAEYQKSPWDEKSISMPPPAAQQGLDWKAEYLKSVESGCITLDELRETLAELEATNRQVEILSDALAESRREVAALKAVQEPWGYGRVSWGEKMFLPTLPSVRDGGWMALYTTPPAQTAPVQQEPIYQMQMMDGKWIDQAKQSYEYNKAHGRHGN